jgi:hypothetical protein
MTEKQSFHNQAKGRLQLNTVPCIFEHTFYSSEVVVSISLVVIMFVVMYQNLSPFKKLLFRNFNEYYIHSYVLFKRINTS